MNVKICRTSLALVCVAAALSFAVQAGATTILYVDHAATGDHSGGSWTNAFTSLQDALAAAAAIPLAEREVEIWVAAGTYRPGVNRSDFFLMRSGVAVYGGFRGNETALDQRDPSANITVLSGDIDENDEGDPSRCDAGEIRGENSYHVVNTDQTDGTAILDGFVITAGDAGFVTPSGGESHSNRGGGVYNADGNGVLRNVTICGNAALWHGGGVYVSEPQNKISFLRLEGAMVSGNRARRGGGVANSGALLRLTNSTILGNTAVWGGGLYAMDSGTSLLNVRIIGNSAEEDPEFLIPDGSGIGGGIMTETPTSRTDLTLLDVLVYGNEATNGGGGIWAGQVRASLNNVTMIANKVLENPNPSSASDALAIASGLNGSGSCSVRNSIIWNNGADDTADDDIYVDGSVTVEHSDIQMPNPTDDPWPGIGNIHADPLLALTPLDARPQGGSPAIDAGGDVHLELLPHDLDGNPRVIGAAIDMGAYEYEPPLTLSADVTPVTCQGGNDGAIDLTVAGGFGDYSISWSDGDATTEDRSALTARIYTVTVRDSDGCESSLPVTVTVRAAIELTLTVTPLASSPTGLLPTVQYSDRLKLEARTTPQVDGSIVYTLERSVNGTKVLDLGTAAVVDGVAQTLTPQVLIEMVPRDRRYLVRAVFTSSAGCGGATQFTFVNPEDATVTPAASNRNVFTVAEATAGFTLRIAVSETLPEPLGDPPGTAAGDINRAIPWVSLMPIDGALAISGHCQATAQGTAYAYVERIFDCSFSNVPFNTYEVHAGAGDWYYVAVSRLVDTLTVYDPAAGFVTGGGTFSLPESEDRVNFGLVYRLTGKDKAPRGNLLVIRHMDDGEICRLKSNGLGAPAISGNTASFSGRGSYACFHTDGTAYLEAGNVALSGWVEDNDRSGVPDRFWIHAPGTAFTMNKPPATHAAPLTGGNVQVPQKGH